ncbi:MAG: 50S ribosomal protein P1 [Candidatus Undinarchaeales archaeon]|jgi:large subunit ribosomal protein L12|nr:50S ribosomal protein P1 [Candidatus Undinarchaeales archaeon]MDP7491945.1 50S ribosomal protein P1 [Candidatus Undinarchaeales archaeon]
MEYVYAAMLLHKAGKDINEANLKKVVTSTGTKADETRIKALVSALEGVDIAEVIDKAAIMPTAATAAPAAAEAAPAAEKAEEKEEDTEAKAEEAVAGLGALFG